MQSDGSKNLWAECLRQAAQDLAHSDELIRRQAELWFSSRDTHPGSFCWVCQQLDLDEAKFLNRIFLKSGLLKPLKPGRKAATSK